VIVPRARVAVKHDREVLGSLRSLDLSLETRGGRGRS